ncbi:MAG: hypothetical protein GVY36_01895 [Verrucomicrobia bacterium]|jgi:hypothetical protein|nr:hypothetical protein [Verrucomicrobiota bacterium]
MALLCYRSGGRGFFLRSGLAYQGDPIPIFSIKGRYALGEIIQLEPDGSGVLNFLAERADPNNFYRWIYVVQRSTDLKAWENEAHYPGNHQSVSHPIARVDSAFWRILIASEKDFKPFGLNVSGATLTATAVTMAWRGAEAAERYDIHLSISDGEVGDSVVFTTTEPTLTVGDLLPGTSYSWQVVAVYEDNFQVFSKLAYFATPAE